MESRWSCCIGTAAVLLAGVLGSSGAGAQEAVLKPIPAAECQKFAAQIQTAVGFTMTATEDDYTDLAAGSEGRSCHIAGSAANQTFAAPADLMAKIAAVFTGWREDPARADDGPDGADKEFANGARLAAIGVSWEPGAGTACSDKEPLSACKLQPQQKLWTAIVDIAEKGGK